MSSTSATGPTPLDVGNLQPVTWIEAEPARLERDQRDVAVFEPSLKYIEPGASVGELVVAHGGWAGTLPLWPFDRPAPEGLEALIGGRGLDFVLVYPAAYPMVHPEIRPLTPQPEMIERTQATWHVLPDGGLCLLQSEGSWLPEASIVELLLKAAGWRIEYALMKAGAIEKMALSGIVSDDSFDNLVTITATATATATPDPSPVSADENPDTADPGPASTSQPPPTAH